MVFDAKNFFANAGNISLCILTPRVVYSIETGTTRPLYGGLFKVGASGKRGFYPTWVTA
jgi:hypothetical protein